MHIILVKLNLYFLILKNHLRNQKNNLLPLLLKIGYIFFRMFARTVSTFPITMFVIPTLMMGCINDFSKKSFQYVFQFVFFHRNLCFELITLTSLRVKSQYFLKNLSFKFYVLWISEYIQQYYAMKSIRSTMDSFQLFINLLLQTPNVVNSYCMFNFLFK